MRRVAIAVVVFLVGFVAYSVMYPTTSYRFRITLNVDTPQGLKSGSSVMEVRDRRYPAWTTLGSNIGESSLKGEAVFVDLGPGADGKPRNVFALLALGSRGEGGDFYLLPGKVFEPLWKKKFGTPEFRGTSWELPKLPAGTKAVLRDNLIPTMLTFADPNDPLTARVVRADEFEQAFGTGVTFRNVDIEIVPAGTWPLTFFGISGEPLTRGIEQKLPWWDRQLPWYKPIGNGVYADTRRDDLRWGKEHFKKGT